MSRFKRGLDWPNEGFVQQAIEAHFRAAGYAIDEHKTIDLVCVHPGTGERWSVEAKGSTSSIGLDFRTGLGQLLQGMKCQGVQYGLAMPDLAQFRKQVDAVPSWVVEALGIHWIFVQEDGTVVHKSLA